MASFNKVLLIGNLTSDPELRHTANGIAVTDLRLAVNRNYTTKEGDRREDVLFIDVTVWNRTAENCCQYLRKGRPVHIEGYLKMDTWDDKSTGEKRSKVKVEAENVLFLGSKQDSGGGGDDDYAPSPRRDRDRDTGPPRGRVGTGNGTSAESRRPSPPPTSHEPDPDEDDIPF